MEAEGSEIEEQNQYHSNNNPVSVESNAAFQNLQMSKVVAKESSEMELFGKHIDKYIESHLIDEIKELINQHGLFQLNKNDPMIKINLRLPLTKNSGHYRGCYFFYHGQIDQNNKFTGMGHLLLQTSGDFIVGTFDQNVLNGPCAIYFANGDYFVGDMFNNQRKSGTLIKANGDIYKGGFRNNLYYGNGTIHYDDGRHYTGEFFKGSKEGEGIFTW